MQGDQVAQGAVATRERLHSLVPNLSDALPQFLALPKPCGLLSVHICGDTLLVGPGRPALREIVDGMDDLLEFNLEVCSSFAIENPSSVTSIPKDLPSDDSQTGELKGHASPSEQHLGRVGVQRLARIQGHSIRSSTTPTQSSWRSSKTPKWR